MSALDLTTLARAKLWLGMTTISSDQALAMAITNISSRVLGYLERPSFVSQPFVDSFDGQNTAAVFLCNWPVTSIDGVVIDGSAILTAEYPQPGWVYEPWGGLPPGRHQSVGLIGRIFCRGKQNCKVNYTAGYLQKESAVITSGHALAGQPYGCWLADNGVVSAGGVVFQAVTGTPASGEYQLDVVNLGSYNFNAADDGTQVVMSYSYCPFVVEGIVWNMINEDYALRSHAGQKSRSLAQMETVTWDNSGMPPYAAMALQPYKNVLPL